ncbi:MAG: hypothetical protein RJA07_569 [Bacteroidota bacterium]|jgi:SAM-dependent methyltransferase
MKKIYLLLLLLIPMLFSFKEQQKKKFRIRFKNPKEIEVFWSPIDQKFVLTKGMNIVDFGAGEPSLAFYLLNKYDSINVVTQDIDTTYISDYKIDSVKRFYGKFDKKFLKMKIPFVMGNETSTNLPKNKFDAVILTAVHHELVYKDATIKDLHEALKADGRLYVSELVAHRKIKRPECDNYFSIESELVADYETRDFVLEKKIVNEIYHKGKKNKTENACFIFKKK